MTELEQLTQAIEKLITKLDEPRVPLDQKSWTSAQCAAYLNRSVSNFQQHIASQPSFPRASKGRGYREWKAQDVIDWNMKRFN